MIHLQSRKSIGHTRYIKLYLHSPRLGEYIGMDVHHKVSARCVLHDKAHMLRCLEASEEVHQERVLRGVHYLKDPLFTHQTDKVKETEVTRAVRMVCRKRLQYGVHRNYFIVQFHTTPAEVIST